jgi:hypothetical protein
VNVRPQTSRNFRKNKREYVKEKCEDFETNRIKIYGTYIKA